MRVYSAPGRTELGGNHTDHQHGYGLAGAVTLDLDGGGVPERGRLHPGQVRGFNKLDVIDLTEAGAATGGEHPLGQPHPGHRGGLPGTGVSDLAASMPTQPAMCSAGLGTFQLGGL
ncbi:MAG: galactokinase family protein [Faecalibacterium sp.]